MRKLRYVGAIDEVDVPLIGASVKRGDEFDATEEQAAVLLRQSANFEHADKPAAKKSTAKPKGDD